VDTKQEPREPLLVTCVILKSACNVVALDHLVSCGGLRAPGQGGRCPVATGPPIGQVGLSRQITVIGELPSQIHMSYHLRYTDTHGLYKPHV